MSNLFARLLDQIDTQQNDDGIMPIAGNTFARFNDPQGRAREEIAGSAYVRDSIFVFFQSKYDQLRRDYLKASRKRDGYHQDILPRPNLAEEIKQLKTALYKAKIITGHC